MSETAILALPLIQPSQAQKHVTVNEALVRLDGIVHLTLRSASLTIPPATPDEGDAYAVPLGAVNAWAGRAGHVAVASNGGWVFVPARRGWRATLLDHGTQAVFDGTDWRSGAMTLSGGGAGLSMHVLETDVTLVAGPTQATSLVIPERAIVFGVTGRVLTDITGSLGAWSVGIAGEADKYGSGLGLARNSWVDGPGTPEVFWSTTAIEVTAEAGDFAAGSIRLALHFAALDLPDAV